MPLILDADRLDKAAQALEFAAEGLWTPDGRPVTGPQLSRDGYRNWVRQVLENLTGDSVRPSDERVARKRPEETWPT